MRIALSCLAAFLLVSTPASAAPDPGKPISPPPRAAELRGEAAFLPGDTMADAIPIPSLPFEITGSTVGYTTDYGDMCPYGCLGPDVVYSFAAEAEEFVEISVCNEGTDFDTNLYVFRGYPGPMVACNEDACSTPGYPLPYLSRIRAMRVQPGNTYYIVVSGYCGEAGTYRLTVGPVEDPFLVRPDGSGAFPDIQTAILQSVDGDTIDLADGVFTGDGNRELRYYGKAIQIRSRSGNASTCIIDAQGAGTAFVFDEGEGPASVLDGVTIRNGFAVNYNGGGAIVCFSAYPTIRRCIFTDNRAERGGACAFWWSSSSAAIEDCLFLSNQATDKGGAVYCVNHAESELMPSFRRCTFTGNSAPRGGAIAILYGRPEFINCTIVKNAAVDSTGTAGGIYSPGGSPVTLQNTIVAFNHAAITGGALIGAGEVSCCDVYQNFGGNWSGMVNPIGTNGNISLDPRFCDYENRDFTLAADSPCRPFSPASPECDLVGAWPVACAPTAVEDPTGPEREGLNIHPSPFTNTCRILLRSGQPQDATALTIHDLTGRIVRRLSSGTANAGSTSEIKWDGRDDDGRLLASGVYLVRIANARGTSAARVILVR